MKFRRELPLVLLTFALALALGGPLQAQETSPKAPGQSVQPPAAAPQSGIASPELRKQATTPKHLPAIVSPADEAASVNPADTPARSEAAIPDKLRDAVLEDASKQAGAAAAPTNIVTSEAVTWPDGSLGCPQPGNAYTQMLVPGYRIEVLVNGKRYDYRADQHGNYFLCPPRKNLAPRPQQPQTGVPNQ